MLSEKVLIKAAKELNDVLGLDPPIVTVRAKIEDLVLGIKEGMKLIVPDEDEITKETKKVLDELAGEVAPQEEELEEDEPQEDEEEVDEAPPVKKDKPVAPKTKAEHKEQKGARKTRASVMRDILYSEPRTAKEMIEEMHRRYGGSENEATFQTTIFLRILMELDLLEAVDGNKLKYIGR